MTGFYFPNLLGAGVRGVGGGGESVGMVLHKWVENKLSRTAASTDEMKRTSSTFPRRGSIASFR